MVSSFRVLSFGGAAAAAEQGGDAYDESGEHQDRADRRQPNRAAFHGISPSTVCCGNVRSLCLFQGSRPCVCSYPL